MNALFYETTSFSTNVHRYLHEDAYLELQQALLDTPDLGAVMPRTGGFRKLRWFDAARQKGTRGGLRVIYYWLIGPRQFWMFMIYDQRRNDNAQSGSGKGLETGHHR